MTSASSPFEKIVVLSRAVRPPIDSGLTLDYASLDACYSTCMRAVYVYALLMFIIFVIGYNILG